MKASPVLSDDSRHRATLAGAGCGQKPVALLVSPDCHDTAALKPLFDRQQWKLYTADTLESALKLLDVMPIPVVVSERDLPPYDWRLLFERTRDLPHRPSVVVVSSLADEHLWSEVLNLGGHDVLAKPFRESEVLHVLTHAWRQWLIARGVMMDRHWPDLFRRSA